MPASYTHTTLPTGTPVTQAMYNRAHQNHVTNFVASNISSEVDDATAMQTVIDPGEVDTEVTTSNILEDLQQLAKMLEEMRGVDPWYTSTGTVTMHLPMHQYYYESGGSGLGGANYFPEIAAVNNGVLTLFRVPEDYRSGSITITWYTNWTVDNLRILFQLMPISENVAPSVAVTSETTFSTPPSITLEISESDITTLGTQFFILAVRKASHAGDTSTAHIFVHAAYASYTGYRGYRGYR